MHLERRTSLGAPRCVARATLVGPVAVRALREGARGSVRAVFDRSLYVALERGWVCAGPTALGAGPLNLLCEPWPAIPPIGALLQVGDVVRVEGAVLHAGRFSVPLAAAQPWHPAPPGAWSTASLARGLAALADALPPPLPVDGLARLLRPADAASCATPLLASAQAPAVYLAELCADAATAGRDIAAERIAPLIGLGPGLTPSGDDYLGGVLIALALTGRTTLRDRLWDALAPHLATRTGDISRAHLAAAAEGLGAAPIHALLAAILADRTLAIAECLAAVAAIGHTSGWDALAGAVSVLRTA
jgi:hypothetical protein